MYASIGLAYNIRACILGGLIVPYDQIDAYIHLCSAKDNVVYDAIMLHGDVFIG